MAERTVRIAADRLPGWVGRFEARHGAVAVEVNADRATLLAPDGAQAEIAITWGGLAADEPRTLAAVYNHVAADRRVAVLLARRAAHAVGIFHGTHLVASKVDTHYVQAHTKAGGWSQKRYARRRSHQAASAAEGAAQDLRRVIEAQPDEWDWFVTGGDAVAVAAVLALCPHLSAVAPARVVPTVDPRLAVLQAFADEFRAVPITLNELA